MEDNVTPNRVMDIQDYDDADYSASHEACSTEDNPDEECLVDPYDSFDSFWGYEKPLFIAELNNEIDESESFEESCMKVREICRELGIPESNITVDDEYSEDESGIQNPDRNGLNIVLSCDDVFTVKVNYYYYKCVDFLGDYNSGVTILVQECFKDDYTPCRNTNRCLADYLATHLPEGIETEEFSFETGSYVNDSCDILEGPAKMKVILHTLMNYMNDSSLQVKAAKQNGYMCHEKAASILRNINDDDEVWVPVIARIIDVENWKITESLEIGVMLTKNEYYFLICEILKDPFLIFNELLSIDSELAAKINETSCFWVQNESETGLKPFYIDLTPTKELIEKLLQTEYKR